ncbi:hypothetical protein E2C01_007799 [Portunus trituberculatus]|uniref:Uncharacterized protein n=1 Tax=Portunus trituberculatus TaxID=210409 RepID=A0A5B7CZ25_PORTR|nr:hypothetical protein [Portunus trituberculatus]
MVMCNAKSWKDASSNISFLKTCSPRGCAEPHEHTHTSLAETTSHRDFMFSYNILDSSHDDTP